MLCLSSLRYPWVSPASHVHLLLAIQTSRILWPLVPVPSSPRVVTVTKPLTMWVYTSLTREDQTLNLYAVKQVTGAWLWTTIHVNKTSIAHNQSPTCQICIPIFLRFAGDKVVSVNAFSLACQVAVKFTDRTQNMSSLHLQMPQHLTALTHRFVSNFLLPWNSLIFFLTRWGH